MTVKELFDAIDRYEVVACNALLALYARQTADEQQSGVTGDSNGRGFTGTDAPFLTSLAKQILQNRQLRQAGVETYPHDLSPRQLAALRKNLRKYWRQLFEIAEKKAAARAAKQTEGTVTIPIVESKPTAPGMLVPTDTGWRFKSAKEVAADTGITIPTTLPRADNFDEFERIIHGTDHNQRR